MKSILISGPKKKRIHQWIVHNSTSIKAWSSFLIALVVVFIVFSDRDFSFLLTLSSIISLFSFIMVAFFIERYKSCSGASLGMIKCYVIVLAARLFSIVPFEGYLPYDRTGDWLYQTTEACSFIVAISIVYLCLYRYKATYGAENDKPNILYFIVPAFLLACAIHPSLNAFKPSDISWTFAFYLEAVACLPQLFMFQKEGKVKPFTTHFLAAQALSKIMSFIFWLKTYSELNDSTRLLKSYVGLWVMIMQIVQLVIMGDFIYHYVRCISKGVPVEFLLTENV